MTKLLVSVRSAKEAEAAIAGGANIIDIKEPKHGSLGRATDDVIRQIVEVVQDRVPISAALGELLDEPAPPPTWLDFVKVGLAGIPASEWQRRWIRWRSKVKVAVLVAYADIHDVEELAINANRVGAAAFLIDTAEKNGRTLLDFVPIARLQAIRQCIRVPFAVAGSLNGSTIDDILPLRPEIIAVRGAVCHGGRGGEVDTNLVRGLANRLAQYSPPT